MDKNIPNADPGNETFTIDPDERQPRRSFLAQLLAGGLGALAGLIPLGAGIAFFLDPLTRKKSSGSAGDDGFVKVATTEALPESGAPRRFTVRADKSDAWNQYLNQPIGAVFLRREDDGSVTAFNQRCPHLGCSVDYSASAQCYRCPCHDSSFALDGEPNNEIPPRGLDSLDVQIRNGNEIWVKFQNFRATTAEKIPV